MKWRSTTKKEGSGNSRRETLESYEQKYLEKFDKVKSEIQKIQKKQKDVEIKELKDRIARRLKLEKEAGKKYKKIITKTLKPETKADAETERKVEAEIETKADAETVRKVEAEIETKAEILADVKSTIQKRMSNVFKGFRESQSKPSTVAEDTRNFVRKHRTERVETVEENIVSDESVNKQIKKEEEKERIKAEKFLREAEAKEKNEEKEKHEAEKVLKEDIKKKRDDEKEKDNRLLSEAEKNEEEVKKQKTEADKIIENANTRREELAKEALATRSNKTLPKETSQKLTSGGPHTDEENLKKKTSKPKKGKLKTEKDIESKIAKLEKKLQKEEKVSSDFVKSTLDTAVSEGWTKTKTVEELRKSKEKITVKKAKDLVKEAFDVKTKKK